MPRLIEQYKGEYGVDFYLRVGKGEINGFKSYSIFGYKQGISTAILDDISQIPATTTIPYPNGIQLRAVSSSASDVAAGTGIRTLELYYLDANYDIKNETITLNGLTPVNTVATNIQRILWMHSLTGDPNGNGVAVGNISLTNLAGTVTYEYIAAGGNRSLTSHFTVPNGKTGLILGWQASSVKQAMSIRLRATVHFHNRALLLPGIFIFHNIMILKDSSLYIPINPPLSFPARCDIKISALADTANGDCESGYSILLVDN